MALDVLKSLFRPLTPASGTSPDAEASLDADPPDNPLSAIFSAGVDAARAEAVRLFRESPEGQRIEAEATRQKIREIMSAPMTWILGGAAAFLMILGLLSFARR